MFAKEGGCDNDELIGGIFAIFNGIKEYKCISRTDHQNFFDQKVLFHHK